MFEEAKKQEACRSQQIKWIAALLGSSAPFLNPLGPMIYLQGGRREAVSSKGFAEARSPSVDVDCIKSLAMQHSCIQDRRSRSVSPVK